MPEFTKDTGIEVSVIAVGTGRALQLGRNGDVDVMLVHAKAQEEQFVAEGYGVERFDVCYNDFIIVGPNTDPSGAGGSANVVEAFARINQGTTFFISRGDESGTHIKEKAVWAEANLTPSSAIYLETGRGMEEVLFMANEQSAYTLTDRGTFISVADKLDLSIIYQGDPSLFNQYGIIAVNPVNNKTEDARRALSKANKLIRWIISEKGQRLINEYTVNGEQLFFANYEDE